MFRYGMDNRIKIIIPSLIAGVSAQSSATAPPQGLDMTTQAEPPLVARELFFSHGQRMHVRLSPDGQWLTFIAPDQNKRDTLAIYKAPVEAPDQVELVFADGSARFPAYRWGNHTSRIIIERDLNGDENTQLTLIDIKTKAAHPIDHNPTVKHLAMSMVSSESDWMLYGKNDRDRRFFDFYAVNLETLERKQVFINNEGFLGLSVDEEMRPRLGFKYSENGSILYFVRSENDTEWTLLFEVPFENVTNTLIRGVDWQLGRVFMTDSRGHDKALLKALQLDSGRTKILSETILAESPLADIKGAITSRDGKRILSARFEYTRVQDIPVAPGFEDELAAMQRVAVQGRNFDVVSSTRDEKTWLLKISGDRQSDHYVLWNRENFSGRLIYRLQPELDALPLQPMIPLVIKSRDHLDLVSYLTLPAGVHFDPQNPTRRASQAKPMVLLVHGGPWDRDSWGYDPLHQWLANRGYAVLSVNYRGSKGFGAAFEAASFGEWGRKMQDDLIDAVHWAVEQGIAVSDRVAIMGGSYGGYAALAGLTFTPDFFAAAVSLVGPSSLLTLERDFPSYWRPLRANHIRRMGADAETENGREFLKQRSPLYFADRVRRPLLMGHGDNDSRVSVNESTQMAETLLRLNIPVTLVRFADEGHGLLKPQNRQSFYAVVEAFLQSHLGGRAEPIRLTPNTTMNVTHGVDQIPGLEQALRELTR